MANERVAALVLLAIGLWFAAPETAPPCLGPDVIRPRWVPCQAAEPEAGTACSILIMRGNDLLTLRGWDLHVPPHNPGSRPGLSDRPECLCRMAAAYPAYVVWADQTDVCGVPTV